VAEAEAVWTLAEEVETVPVTVEEEAEPWSGARRHGAEEAHSRQAPRREEPEKVAAVEAPDGAGTPARAWSSVQVVAGPLVVRVEALESRVARRGAPGDTGAACGMARGTGAMRGAAEGTKPTSGATNGTGTTSGAREGSGAARGARVGGVPEEPAGKGKTETGGCTTGSKNMDSMSGSGVGVEEEEKGKSDSSNTTCRQIRTLREVRS
jgi:hypothetical protein